MTTNYREAYSKHFIPLTGEASRCTVFTQACSPFMPSGASVYTKPGRSAREWPCAFFSLFRQWKSCQFNLGQHLKFNHTSERETIQLRPINNPIIHFLLWMFKDKNRNNTGIKCIVWTLTNRQIFNSILFTQWLTELIFLEINLMN